MSTVADASSRPATATPLALTVAERTGIVFVVATSVVLRFVTDSPLWLDEALSVNIASLPLGDLTDALRRDGHPPLYYVLLHGWMILFGDGDTAVRTLSGVASVATLPLAWIAGRRRLGRPGAWTVLLVVAIAPYDLRYATETRMYALVMLLVLAAHLLVDDLLARTTAWRVVALAGVTGALLWTHYWALWLGAAAALLVGRVALRQTGEARRRALTVLAALAVGAVTFAPWVPHLLHQSANTGTPWARPATPTRVVDELMFDVGGGPHPESLGWSLLALLLVGLALFARSLRGSDRLLELDLGTQPLVRREVSVAAATLAVGLLAGYASQATFASRYGAVFLPLVFVAVGAGLAIVPNRRARAALGLALIVLAAAGAYRNVTIERTQAGVLATAIRADAASDDLVMVCPDQLGPALDRALGSRSAGDLDVVVFPTLDGPELIDWTDYAERNEAADPASVAARALDRAGDGAIWLVWSGDYRTLEDACPALLGALGSERFGREVVPNGGTEFFEHAALWVFDAA